MIKEFIPHQEALELKELGFDEPCFGYYEPNKKFEYLNWETFKDFPYLAKNSEWQDLYGAPLYQQAFRWFREKYNLFGQVNIHTYFIYNISNDGFEMIKQYDKLTNTYEESELECLKKLIEIVKNKGGDK
jgi:hypothetical protein